jgi:integrase
MVKAKINFTDYRLRQLVHDGSNKRLYFYDSGQPGLALQITPSGTKSFQIQTWDKVRGKSVVKSIGRYPAMSIDQARRQVAALLKAVKDGKDVIDASQTLRDEPTFGKLFSHWLESAKKHKRSWRDDQARYDLYMKDIFDNKKLSWFTREKIRRWHVSLTDKTRQRKGQDGKAVKISGTTANRALALVSVVFNDQLPDGPNPCKGVKKFKETSRDRFLHPQELKKFFSALDSPNTSTDLRDYILTSLFTGARRSNVLAMMWKDIDIEQATWRIPPDQSKNAESMIVPLVLEVLEILTSRSINKSSVFVFPGRGKTGHIIEPKRSWSSLLRRADLTDVRLHDLRRTMGSYQTITGASTAIVGKTLGHKSQTATQVYARLNLDPVRASMERAVDMMMTTKDLPDKVATITQSKK